jgi:4'-phosphopantetheinyl transferase
VNETAARDVYLVSGQLADVPEHDEWLSTAEQAVLATLRLQKRRHDWRLGRWLARRAVERALGELPREFEVMAAADGAPEVHGCGTALAISISHRHGRGLAAAARGDDPIGCDLELVEPRTERFVRDWLTAAESAHVAAAAEEHRALLANLCWSGKESASKVLRVGLRFDTRSFDVGLPEHAALERAREWQPLHVRALRFNRELVGRWRMAEGFVETLLADVPLVPVTG